MHQPQLPAVFTHEGLHPYTSVWTYPLCQVNDIVRDADERLKLMEVHERLRRTVPGLISPARRVLLETKAPLCRLDGSTRAPLQPKMFQVWLLSDRLLLARPDRYSDQYFRLKEDIPLQSISLEWHRSSRQS